MKTVKEIEMHRKIILWFTLSIVNALTFTRIFEINQGLDLPTIASFDNAYQIPSERRIGDSDVIYNTISMSLSSSDNLNPAKSIHKVTSKSEWIMTGPGEINVPILLYHHVCDCPSPSWLETDIELFESQMEYLVRHGYQTITTTQLREAVLHGTTLPPKPVIITFDDGNENIFKYAFPIMESYGLKGTMYVITERLEWENFVSIEQLLKLSASGWEIGSHTITHPDLTSLSSSELKEELLDSRLRLEEALGMEINTLAYPYGLYNAEVADNALNYGYSTVMGLGTYVNHGSYSLYYLNRQPVDGPDAMEDFNSVCERSASS